MTTYAWPNTRQFVPQLAELRVVDSLQRVHESPLSGYTQTQSMPGARWGWGFTFPDQAEADRQALEGYLLRLSGREHRVQLWDHKRPRPRGNIALTGVTMGAAAAQFATTLTLAGCRAAPNLLRYSMFGSDASGDGVADNWAVSGMGSTGTIAADRLGSADGTFQRLFALALGSGTENRVMLSGASVAVTVGLPYTISASVNSINTGHSARLLGVWLDGGGGYLGEFQATHVMTGSLYRIVATSTAPVGAVSIVPHAFMCDGSSDSRDLWVQNFMVEQAAAASVFPKLPTMLAGDWLGLAGGQLVRVVTDATANDAGDMTVEVRHMLRQAATSGSAVTLDRPTALYVRAESGLVLPRQPGPAEPGMAIDFVEAFA